jgi:hypothetical protein
LLCVRLTTHATAKELRPLPTPTSPDPVTIGKAQSVERGK